MCCVVSLLLGFCRKRTCIWWRVVLVALACWLCFVISPCLCPLPPSCPQHAPPPCGSVTFDAERGGGGSLSHCSCHCLSFECGANIAPRLSRGPPEPTGRGRHPKLPPRSHCVRRGRAAAAPEPSVHWGGVPAEKSAVVGLRWERASKVKRVCAKNTCRDFAPSGSYPHTYEEASSLCSHFGEGPSSRAREGAGRRARRKKSE